VGAAVVDGVGRRPIPQHAHRLGADLGEQPTGLVQFVHGSGVDSHAAVLRRPGKFGKMFLRKLSAVGRMAAMAGRRGILMALKKSGPLRAEDVATQLGITPSAVRQHLTGLHSDGLVEFEEVRSGPGRPKHLYRLTPAAEELFPKTYSDLTNELLDYAGSTQPGLVDDLFEMRRRRRADEARARLEGKDFDGRVEELTKILD